MAFKVSTTPVINSGREVVNITGATGVYSDFTPEINAVTNTLNFDFAMSTATMTGAVTFSETNKVAGRSMLLLLDTSSSSHTPTFSGNIAWNGGVIPSWNTCRYWQVVLQCVDGTAVRGVARGFGLTAPAPATPPPATPPPATPPPATPSPAPATPPPATPPPATPPPATPPPATPPPATPPPPADTITLSGTLSSPNVFFGGPPIFTGAGSTGFILQNGLEFAMDGVLYRYELTSGPPAGLASKTPWISGEWCDGAPSTTYYLRVEFIAGNGIAALGPNDGDPLDTWLSLDSPRFFAYYGEQQYTAYGGADFLVKAEISTTADGSNIIATGYYQVFWEGGA